jgi:beta-barrel assembly-enhancing protease
MRQRWYLIASFALLGAALVVAQRRPVKAVASGQAILSMVADSERELSRMPAKFTRLSDAEEIRAGNALAEGFSPAGKMSADDATIEAYVQQIGGRIAPFAQRKLPYRFHYIPNRDFINAFALPGGHIFVGAGLIERMETDDELADVLGHEIEHIDHFHCAERLQVEAALRKIPLAQVISIPIEIFQAGYSKEQEIEADREGVRLAARRGYSAHGAIRLFETFERLSEHVAHAPGTPQQELSGVAVDILTGYFRSHPAPSERIAQIRAMIGREPALDRPEQPMKIGYIFLAWQSIESIGHEKFADAAALASRALQSKPDHPPALQALAEAKFGGGDLPAGQSAYRVVLARDPAAAADVAKWTESRAGHLLDQQNYDGAIALVRSLLDLQPNEAALLRLFALAQVGKGDAAAASATAQTLRRLYPAEADGAGQQTSQRAKDLLGEQKFAEAATMAGLSLALKAGDAEALHTLGDAEFARARFSEAAAAYQQLLNEETSDAALLRTYADAAGSARPKNAALELQSLVSSKRFPQLPKPAIDTEMAGLSLMAAADDRAQSVQQAAEQGTVAPEYLARLGWWAFRAGRIKEARAILQKAAALRPADDEVRSNLAWVDLEEGNNVQTVFETISSFPDSILKDSTDAGTAINSWQQKKTDLALTQWKAVRLKNPQWRVASWRNTIYPPHIVQAVAEMEAELDRREAARLQRVSRPRVPAAKAPK